MVLNLYNSVLQIPQIDLAFVAIVVSSIIASILAFTVIITWKSIRQNTNATYSQLLRGFHEDLTTRLNKNSVLKTTEDCERYANDYLNTVDEIAFLDIHGKIPPGIAKYFERFFAYGFNMIDWYNGMVGEDFLGVAKKNWPNFFLYCEKYGINLNPEDKLPKIMLDFNQRRNIDE